MAVGKKAWPQRKRAWRGAMLNWLGETLIEGQGHFLTLAQGCVHTKIQT